MLLCPDDVDRTAPACRATDPQVAPRRRPLRPRQRDRARRDLARSVRRAARRRDGAAADLRARHPASRARGPSARYAARRRSAPPSRRSRWRADPIERRAGAKMLACVALFGAATIVFGLSRSFTLSLRRARSSSARRTWSASSCDQSLVQLATPDAMRGRVSAVNMVFIGASNELGEFESGLTAQWFGAVPVGRARRRRHAAGGRALGVAFPEAGAGRSTQDARPTRAGT